MNLEFEKSLKTKLGHLGLMRDLKSLTGGLIFPFLKVIFCALFFYQVNFPFESERTDFLEEVKLSLFLES